MPQGSSQADLQDQRKPYGPDHDWSVPPLDVLDHLNLEEREQPPLKESQDYQQWQDKPAKKDLGQAWPNPTGTRMEHDALYPLDNLADGELGKANECHNPGGSEEGGQFCSTVSGGGAVTSRSERAKLTYKPSTAAKQAIADKSEEELSKALGMKRSPNNSPFDLYGKGVGVECKTFVDNAHDKVTCHPESCQRKRDEAKRLGLKAFTVVVDKRGSKVSYYYKEGVGSFRLASMNSVSLSELKRIIR